MSTSKHQTVARSIDPVYVLLVHFERRRPQFTQSSVDRGPFGGNATVKATPPSYLYRR